MKSKRIKLQNKLEMSPASDLQKKYAKTIGVIIPEGATKSDAAAILDRELDDDQKATDELKDYARRKEIQCSDYVGNRYLHNLMFDHLKDEDLATFFCFCVYKFCKELEGESIIEDLEALKEGSVFVQFGSDKVNDGYFMESMKDYMGEETIAFGKTTKVLPNGKIKNIYGGSNQTRAYKESYDYLKKQLLLK